LTIERVTEKSDGHKEKAEGKMGERPDENWQIVKSTGESRV
jgi:hypothetical protein